MKSILLGGVIGLALGGFIGYHFIYTGHQKQVRNIAQQLEVEQADQEVQKSVSALLEQVEQYRQHLPPEPEPSWLVREAATLGRKAGLELTTISPEFPQPFQQFTRLAVNLQFNTTYHQLGAFLDALEHSEHLIHVERLAITGTGSSSAGAEVPIAVQLVLSTLYLPPNSLAAQPLAKK